MERDYTITVKITRRYARKIDKRSKLDDVRRRVQRALPDGWMLSDATINLRSDGAKAKKKREARREKTKAVTAARREAAAKERKVRAEQKKQQAAFEKATWVSPSFEPSDRAWIVAVFEAERMRGWKARLATRPPCWSTSQRRQKNVPLWTGSRIIEVPSEIGTRVGPRIGSHLLRRGCGYAVVRNTRMSLLMDVAHYRRWKAWGDHYAHDGPWRISLLNLLRKHCPEAFTEAAIAMTTIGEMK